MTERDKKKNSNPPPASETDVNAQGEPSAAEARAAATDAAFEQTDREPSPKGEEAIADGVTDQTARIDQLESELEQANQRTLRLQAELENFRKRTQRTMEEERRFACVPLVRDLLTVVDNLQRAIDAAEQHGNASGLLEGVKMVSQHLLDILKQHHCVPIEAEGVAFDPHLHEAIGQQPSTSQPPGTVLHVATKGYQLHDRVVRPSQVIVAAASDNASDEAETGETAETSDAETPPEGDTDADV